MKRILWATALLPSLISGFGCAMCENCLDYDGPAYGGICEDAGCGRRAGSIISPPCGEMIVAGPVMKDDQAVETGDQQTGAVPPEPEEVPLPQEAPRESGNEGLSLPGFADVPAPIESNPDSDLMPPPGSAPFSSQPVPLDSTPAPIDGGTEPPPLLPDLSPR